MLIMMNLNSSKKNVENIKKKISAKGCLPHEIPGQNRLAIGVTGPTENLTREELLTLPEVEDVITVTPKYKLVSRMMKNEKTEINLGNVTIGGKEIIVIAGPCSVENKDAMFRIAEELTKLGIKFLRGGAFKPRSSPYSFQGLKEEGLKILDEIKKEFGLKIVTEALNQKKLSEVAEVADVLQIGARNMQNYALLEELGALNKPVLLKRGMSATVEEWLLSAEYIAQRDNYNIILCERGIRTFENSTRNTLDLNAVQVIKSQSHLPIFVDPSHGVGIRDKVPAMSLAAIAAGADGLLLEAHVNPDEALSDGFQTISIQTLKELLKKIKLIAPIFNKELNYNEN